MHILWREDRLTKAALHKDHAAVDFVITNYEPKKAIPEESKLKSAEDKPDTLKTDKYEETKANIPEGDGASNDGNIPESDEEDLN
jgi:hypothetical protein